jgi:hypothetical protein
MYLLSELELHVSEKQEVSPQSVMVTSYKVMFFNVTQK